MTELILEQELDNGKLQIIIDMLKSWNIGVKVKYKTKRRPFRLTSR